MTSLWPDSCEAVTWIIISNSADLNFIDGDIHGRACGTKLLIKYQTVLVALIVSAIWSAIDNPNEICISLPDNGWVWKSYPTLYNGCDYLSILGLKLMKGVPGRQWIPVFISSQRKKWHTYTARKTTFQFMRDQRDRKSRRVFRLLCPNSISGNASYRKISRSLEAARFGFKRFQSL